MSGGSASPGFCRPRPRRSARLAVPVIGVVSAAVLLGERPDTAEIIGFALIFAAAACVIFAPRERTPLR